MKRFLFILVCTLFLAGPGLSRPSDTNNNAELLVTRANALLETAKPEAVEEGRRLLRRARALFHESKTYNREAEVLERLARTHLDQGQRNVAFGLADELIELSRTANEPRFEAIANIIRATAYSRAGKQEDAFASGYKAREIFKQLGDHQGLARTSYSLGSQYLEVWDTGPAGVYLSEALTAAGAAKDRRQLSLILERLAVHSNRTGNPEKALSYALKALDTANTADRYTLLTVISATYVRLGRFAEALDYGLRSQEVGRNLRNKNFERTAFNRIGNAQLGLGLDKAAENSFRQVMTVQDDLGGNVTANIGLARVFESRQDLETAAAHYRQAMEVADTLVKRRRTNEDRLGTLTGHIAAYIGAVRGPLQLYFAGHREEHARQAFTASERIRNRIFSEHLALARNREQTGTEYVDGRLESVRRQMNDISRSLLTTSLDAGQASKLQREFQELEFQEAAIKRDLNVRDQRFETNIHVADVRVEDVQSALRPDSAFIGFFTEAPAAAFIVTPQDFRVTALPNLGNVAARVSGYAGLISQASRLDAFGAAAGTALYEDLLAPVLAALPASTTHLILAPDGALEMLPFDALRSGDGRFLIEKFSLSYMPSAQSFSVLSQWRTPAQSRPLLAFADPSYPAREGDSLKRSLFGNDDVRFTPLPYAKHEVASIAAVAGPDAEVFSGAAASEKALKDLDLSKYRVLHFATHGIASQNHPDRSALLLSLDSDRSEDGFLQVREIYNLQLNADLVVLSACQTNHGERSVGQGVGGLARAFFFAGARSLIASLWKVEDRETSDLMTRFYGYLSRGFSKAESLRRTKIDMIRQAGMPPRHWAGFILLGESDGSIEFPKAAATPINAIVVAAFVVLLLGFGTYRFLSAAFFSSRRAPTSVL